MRIDANETGTTDSQYLVDVSCQNESTDLFSDMLISTDVDQQKMFMAVRMQHAIRMGMVEAKHKSALTGLVTVIVNNSRRND